MSKFKPFFLLFPLLLAPCSCEELSGGHKGFLRIYFPDELVVQTRAAGISPDVGEFILSVTDSRGSVVYEGSYGAAPESMAVGAGTYSVSIRSCEFSAPRFDTPLYGDDQVVVVRSGETVSVALNCALINSGIKLNVNSSFLSDYPDGVLYVKSAEGRLMYGYTEKRTAYVKPGAVSLTLSDAGDESTLFTRTLQPREVLVVNVSTSGKPSSGGGGSAVTAGRISVSIDTTRSYVSENFTIGGETPGTDVSRAYSVSQAHTHAGEKGVWVYGYIVGGDLSSSKCSFDAPFSARTNLAIAARSSCTDKASCLSVQLSKGDIRDDINLVDHEEYLGRQIYLKGDIVESYFGITGLQNLTDYRWKQ